jgi:hypothetical protein
VGRQPRDERPPPPDDHRGAVPDHRPACRRQHLGEGPRRRALRHVVGRSRVEPGRGAHRGRRRRAGPGAEPLPQPEPEPDGLDPVRRELHHPPDGGREHLPRSCRRGPDLLPAARRHAVLAQRRGQGGSRRRREDLRDLVEGDRPLGDPDVPGRDPRRADRLHDVQPRAGGRPRPPRLDRVPQLVLGVQAAVVPAGAGDAGPGHDPHQHPHGLDPEPEVGS